MIILHIIYRLTITQLLKVLYLCYVTAIPHVYNIWVNKFFNSGAGNVATEQTLDNLCGDLNKGYLPLNPTGQNVEGVSYPL